MRERTQIPNPTSNKVAARATFTMRRLRRQAMWACAAAAALFIAVLAGRSEVGSQRAAIVLASLNLASSSSLRPGQGVQFASRPTERVSDMEKTARQLAQTVRGLSEDRDRIMTRLAAMERNIDDVTGSISRQAKAAKAVAAQPVARQGEQPPTTTPAVVAAGVAPAAARQGEQPPPTTTPAVVAAGVAPAAARQGDQPPATTTPVVAAAVAPPAGAAAAPVPPRSPRPAATELPAIVAPPAASAYGAEIGSASSIKALHARWVSIHSAHAQLLEGLKAAVAIRDNARTKRIELRLVVGPLTDAAAAEKLCASLSAVQIACQPTMFDPHQPVLE